MTIFYGEKKSKNGLGSGQKIEWGKIGKTFCLNRRHFIVVA